MMKRLISGAFALAAGVALISAPQANAATGATVSNGGASAYATSSCSNGHIDATVHVTSRKFNQWIEVRSAGLYDGAYGSSYYVQRANAAASTPGAVGNYYAGAQFTWRWTQNAPRFANPALDGDQVVYFVSAAGYPLLPVKVSCPT